MVASTYGQQTKFVSIHLRERRVNQHASPSKTEQDPNAITKGYRNPKVLKVWFNQTICKSPRQKWHQHPWAHEPKILSASGNLQDFMVGWSHCGAYEVAWDEFSWLRVGEY